MTMYVKASGSYLIVNGWNADLVTKAGLDPEVAPVTWDELLANAKKVIDSGAAPFHGALAGYSELSITRFVPSYRQQHHSGVELTLDCERSWPPLDFDTDGAFLRLPVDWFHDVPRDESVKALEHILLSVAPAVVACDPSDLEGSRSGATIYIYDSFGGGVRLSESVYLRLDEVVQLAYRIVSTCPCEHGCPSCVMLPRRPDGNRDLSKRGALVLLERLNA